MNNKEINEKLQGCSNSDGKIYVIGCGYDNSCDLNPDDSRNFIDVNIYRLIRKFDSNGLYTWISMGVYVHPCIPSTTYNIGSLYTIEKFRQLVNEGYRKKDYSPLNIIYETTRCLSFKIL